MKSTLKHSLRGNWATGLLWLLSMTLAGAAPGGWRPLFNGKDLTGWQQVNGKAPYAVLDGAIVGTVVADSPNSFLATEEAFGDFVLEFEVKQEGLSNSGVQFRSLSKAEVQNGRVHGYQCEIDDTDRAWTGGIYDEARRGWLYPVDLNPRARTLYMPGRWNHFRIEAIGSDLRTWVNGVAVAHVVDDMTPRGIIALQVHAVQRPEQVGNRVYWRNLRIQTENLQPSPYEPGLFVRNMMVNQVSAAEQAQGWRLLWDGQTTKGWRGAHKTAFPEAGWKIENCELRVQESGGGEAKHGGDIVTEEMFSAFEFQVEVMLTPGANSGIKYFVTEENNPGGGSAFGLEYQLLDDEKHADAKMGAAGNRTLASLYDLIPAIKLTKGGGIVPKIGAWQHARLVVTPANQVQHWLNGIKVVEYDRMSPALAAMIARSKYEKLPGFGLAPAGRILLQDHGNQVHFRSIKVRTLP